MVRFSHLVAAASSASLASAVNLFVTSYSGNVTTLSLTGSGWIRNLNATYKANVCGGGNSTWLTFDSAARVLYCIDEGWTTPTGAITASSVTKDGQLNQTLKVPTLGGPVSGVFYGNGSTRGYVVAHYGAGAVSAFTSSAPGQLTFLHNFTYTLTKPGPNAARQEAPHPHQVLLDPTGKYILVPDLGADLVRIYTFDPTSLRLQESAPLVAAPGVGPRHAAFWTSPNGTYFYLVNELTNTLSSFKVAYGASGLSFTSIANISTFGNSTDPKRGGAAEIAITPDNKFLIVSNRNDSSLALQSSIAPSKPNERSDQLSVFAIKPDGSLSFSQATPAGGSYPRQFSVNKAGDLVAVGLQLSGRVVILERVKETGLIGNTLASIPVEGEITCVVWDE